MQYFPIFISLRGHRVIVSGGGQTAIAKLRLLLKTDSHILVFAFQADTQIQTWAKENRVTLVPRSLKSGDVVFGRLFYAANDAPTEDARVAAIARSEGAMVNIVDNLEDSDFITPALVDRDPVTIAIGTEGSAPVLARAIKADLEAWLPRTLGPLAQVAKGFRGMAVQLPKGLRRRRFWFDVYFKTGLQAFDFGGKDALRAVLPELLDKHLGAVDDAPINGHVSFVGAGPGDPELLTLKARKALDQADVVIYDQLVGAPILELARREALMINVGKQGFGRSTSQEKINSMLIQYGQNCQQVVRLKGGDATLFGRLNEEIEACIAANIEWHIIPGITAASAAVAAIGQSLTQRGRNSTIQILTGHDMNGFADHDWQTLARPGAVAAIYMGKKSARFIQGRLLMHGANPKTAVSLIENASRQNQRIIATTLAQLPQSLTKKAINGPALILYGLNPRAVVQARHLDRLQETG